MANEVNNVNGAQNYLEVRKQAPVTVSGSVEVEIVFPKTAQDAKPVEFNLYGKDFENFEKFKGNDKHDAMRMTTTAANDVKVAYMQLRHEFPDVYITFEPMPDPKKCGKKREGFITYQQQLEDWKDVALMQISNAREKSTTTQLNNVANAIISNDNVNAGLNAQLTAEAANAIIENDNNNAEAINKNVDAEGAATRHVVNENAKEINKNIDEEAVKTRNTVHGESAYTRNTIRREAAETRNLVRKEAAETRNEVRNEAVETRNVNKETAKQTQEIQALSDKISDVLNNGAQIHTVDTMQRVGELRDLIVSADAPHNLKVQLLNELTVFAKQSIISSKEVARMHTYINDTLKFAGTEGSEYKQIEFPDYEPNPRRETPIVEYNVDQNESKIAHKLPPENNSEPTKNNPKPKKTEEKQ